MGYDLALAGLWPLSGWPALAAAMATVSLLVGAGIKYGPLMKAWFLARFYPPFSVQVLIPLYHSQTTLGAVPVLRVQLPRGNYVLRCRVQVGKSQGDYQSAPSPNERTDKHEFYVSDGIPMHPPVQFVGGSLAWVVVEIQRIGWFHLQRKVYDVKRISVA